MLENKTQNIKYPPFFSYRLLTYSLINDPFIRNTYIIVFLTSFLLIDIREPMIELIQAGVLFTFQGLIIMISYVITYIVMMYATFPLFVLLQYFLRGHDGLKDWCDTAKFKF